MRCPHCGGPLPSPTARKKPEQVAQVLELAARGYTLRDIQDLTGVSFSTAGRIVRQHRNFSSLEEKDE